MPLISSDTLRDLPVFTESEKHLGHVRRWDIDVETHGIVRYHVKPSGLVKLLSSKELVVTPAQVVAVTEEKMIVQDAVEQEQVKRDVSDAVFSKGVASSAVLTRAKE